MSVSEEELKVTTYNGPLESAHQIRQWQPTSGLGNPMPFIIGGTSGMVATTCVQPLDMIKVRLQLSQQGVKRAARPTMLTTARSILSGGRFLDFYQGLSAALARQAVYGTSRLGLFVTFEEALKRRCAKNHTEYGFSHRALASIAAGAQGSVIGNPVEVVLIRMQSDGVRPPEQRQNYRSVFDALARIFRHEGVFTLWSGCLPTVIRAMATNFGQLAFFSESKHQLQSHTHLSEQAQTMVASAVGGFFAAFFSMPFDFLKSRLQSQQNLRGVVSTRKGMIAYTVEIARTEGLFRFYRGFPAYFLRLAPHSSVLCFPSFM